MARREGSHRARRPNVDLLEGRWLLSQVLGHELSRPVGSPVAEQSHQSVVPLLGDTGAGRTPRGTIADKSESEVRDADDAADSRAPQEQSNTNLYRPEQAIPPAFSSVARPMVAAPPQHEPVTSVPASSTGPPSLGTAAGLEGVHGPRQRSVAANRAGSAYLKLPARVALEASLLPARWTSGFRSVSVTALGPQGADILADFLPADAAAIEQAVDRFFDHLESLGDDLARLPEPLDTLPEPVVWLVAAGSLEVARRWLSQAETRDRSRRSAGQVFDELAGGEPPLPGSLPGWPLL